MTLIPLYEPKAILNAWGYCIEGVEEVLKKTTGDVSLGKIFTDIIYGRLLLWVGFDNNKYCGFITTQINQTQFGEKSLWIVHLFIKKGVAKDIFFEGFNIMEDFAIKQGCDKIHFWSIRDKSFSKRMEPLGWYNGYQEFIYNLKGRG